VILDAASMEELAVVELPLAIPYGLHGSFVAGGAPTMPSSDNGIRMRTIVDLPVAERAQLDALCRQRGLSRAEALRQALRLWLEQQKPSHGEVFGLWRDRPEGSLELQEALRQEWDAP
jgi:Arc/MetJ-type ribon-helix-helix transcriptional regulator